MFLRFSFDKELVKYVTMYAPFLGVSYVVVKIED